MRRTCTVFAVAVGLLAAATALAATTRPALTQAQVVSGFKKQTGTTLTLDRRGSYSGHYRALVVPQSLSNIGRYGHFTIWVVTSGQEDDVTSLLSNSHTGTLGTPGAASIYWEQGATMSGTGYWLAKKRYGSNVVLWWYGSARKTDAAFRRLHHALTAIV